MTDRGWRPRRRPRWSFRVASCAAAVIVAGCTPPGLPPPIAPATSTAVASGVPDEVDVAIGVDGFVHGFNPHAIADYSLAGAAVAQLVLPSVSSVQPDGSSKLNADVVDKAEVTSTDPFTVTYTLDRSAAWSDGTPITAEDFSYLREAMLVQPGTVDPAGYRLITGVVSRDAGKSVDVTFRQAVTDWKTLFSPLLPAHILKDTPGGWTEGLAAGIPVSGNRYKMQSYDALTGEITLIRNDKYWGAQPRAGAAVLRLGTPSTLISALARGDLQAVLLQPDAAEQRTLERTVPAARRFTVPLPGTVQLVFNTASGPTADAAVRRAVAAGLDMPALRDALDGGAASGGAAVTSMLELPGAPSAAADGPSGVVTGDAAAAVADLTSAGYRRQSLYMAKDGDVLRLTMTYPASDERLSSTARLVQSQLAAVGIEVDLQRESPLAAVDERLASGAVDLGLVMVPRAPSDALAAASAFACPLAGSNGVRPGVPTGSAQGATTERTNTAATGTTGTTGAEDIPVPLGRTGNLSGFCSDVVERLLDPAVAATPAGAIGGTIGDELEGGLTAALPVLPISRPSAVFAGTAAIAALVPASGAGSAYRSPLSGLPEWPPG